jgi:hypothetical protein
MHRTTQRFWDAFEDLPDTIQAIAQKDFERLKVDPHHPSLHFKKVGRFWSARVGMHYRALAIKDGTNFIWVWIGTHDDYDRLLR